MTDGDANPNADFVPFAPLSPANESIIGLDGEEIIAVSAVNDTAVANADVFTANTIGTHSPSKKYTAVNNARIAGYRYGDGSGADGENFLEIDQLGDTYVFPRTTLTNVKIIGTGASTITIKKNDGTTIETVTISSNDVDSTHGITKTLQRGNRSGAGGADAIFTADSAGIVPAEDLINVTYVSGFNDIPIGSKVDIGGTVAYVVSSPSATTIRLDRQVTTATSTNYTFQPGYLEVAAGSDGPFYIESDSAPFYLVCQDGPSDDEYIMFGSRMNSASSSKRNMFDHDTAFNMPSNATDLRFYPFRTENGKFHYYTDRILNQ